MKTQRIAVVILACVSCVLGQNIDPVIGRMQVKDGVVTLPNTPGLGVDIDPAFAGSGKTEPARLFPWVLPAFNEPYG